MMHTRRIDAGFMRKMTLLAAVSCMLLIAVQPAAAEVTPEKVVVNPSGTASWSDHVEFQSLYPGYGKEAPAEVPFMPMPTKSIDVESLPPSALQGRLPVQGESDDAQNQEAGEPLPGKEAGEKPLIPVISGFQALPDNNTSIPPDTMGAAGLNHLMTMLNTEVRIQDKSGTDLGTVSLTTWWTSGTGLSGHPFDPRVIYDTLSNRWIAVVDAGAGDLTNSRTWLAISDTNDPTGAWKYYSFNMETPGNNAYWHDYPDIGVNMHWIAITNNMFDVSNAFGGVAMWVIDKRSIGGTLTSYRFPEGFDVDTTTGFATDGFTLRPAVTFDAAEAVLYIVDGNRWAFNVTPNTGAIRLSRITGVPPAAPVWSIVPDSAGVFAGSGWFLSPEAYDPWNQINAAQLGTIVRVQTNDQRLLNSVFRDGRLWFTHSGGRPHDDLASPDRTVVSWYQVDPALLNTTGLPTIQSGTLDPGPDGHYFFPSIAVNGGNDVALGFSHSNPAIYIEGVATGRKSNDPLGAIDPVTVIKAGEDSYVKDFGSGRYRWGDYSATVVDPADDNTFWTIQEYAAFDVGPAANDDRWGTWWAHLGTVGCAGLPAGTKDAMLRDRAAEWLGKCVHGLTHNPPTYAGGYTDVVNNTFNRDWIQQILDDGITSGCGDGSKYCPKDPVTKTQAPKLILLAEHGSGYTPPTAMSAPYTDVPLRHPDVNWIARAKAEGVTTGCSAANKYCPDEVLTEQGFQKMLDGAF